MFSMSGALTAGLALLLFGGQLLAASHVRRIWNKPISYGYGPSRR